MLTNNTLVQIKKLAINNDWNNSFGGKSKGNKHLLRVTRIAKFLAHKTNANLKIVAAGAFLHDISLPSLHDDDYKINKKRVKKILAQFNIPKAETDAIAECVASHEGIVIPKTLEAKVVHDADVLEKSGILGIIRHTWKLTNTEKINENNINAKTMHLVLQHLAWRSTRLQTAIARRINQYLNQGLTPLTIKIIIEKTVPQAHHGIITEKIASSLLKELTHTQKEKLKSQLNLSYLKKFS